MIINYLETTFKVYDENKNVKSIQISECTELIPEQGKALVNTKTLKRYLKGHVIANNESKEDYIEKEIN